ncbi:hypothetical protein COU97_00110 [Candidatus Shapirobacteria bacterium CG10_big_fil_rev_8_21_14_0_10_48_15]|uniref:Glycosyltransferase 2-like domain-containing protein n=1 Tax=Candidatus Shapirobacteria bacterium CG10_big_fil_rev_8_21_14_0_10_48_15 TaxID=1974484 RepID=A0A2M8L823_9BACT|nr:MAG: hypothetical protein COU97_00110 [Candidatus Shapirobacteria bacterium CG10_big_fil_rev_8_21_14_0_10_48_15]
MTKRRPYLSVVIPCYNEAKNLQRGVLDEVRGFLQKQKYSYEVIIADDESTDGSLDFTSQYCRGQPHFRLLKNPHGGKAFAVRAGVQAAKGEIVLFTDMDQSTPLPEVKKLLPFFKKNYQVVIGSRGQARSGFSLVRQLGSSVFRLLRQILLLPGIVDTQCGFKTFESKVAKDLFSRLTIFQKKPGGKGWKVGAFDVELLFVAQKRHYKIAEVPVTWHDRDAAVASKGKKYFKESKQMLQEILRVKLNDLQGEYR